MMAVNPDEEESVVLSHVTLEDLLARRHVEDCRVRRVDREFDGSLLDVKEAVEIRLVPPFIVVSTSSPGPVV